MKIRTDNLISTQFLYTQRDFYNLINDSSISKFLKDLPFTFEGIKDEVFNKFVIYHFKDTDEVI